MLSMLPPELSLCSPLPSPLAMNNSEIDLSEGRPESRQPKDEAGDYLTAKTQMAPPSGTSGYSPGNWVFSRACMTRESIPQPDCTATYCLPSTLKDEGCPIIPDFVGNSHKSLPVAASKA